MRRFAGVLSEDDALARYLPLRLQDTRVEKSEQGGNLSIGIWKDRIRYPAALIVVGDAGSGKTTSLLYEAQNLARAAVAAPAAPSPLYTSLSTFNGSRVSDLLSHVAVSNHLSPGELRALWRERQRPLGLFLDGADEMSDRQALGAIAAELLAQGAGTFHSLVITCRPGATQKALRERVPDLHEMLLLALDDAQIDRFLDCYGAGQLRPLLDKRLREIVQRPDVLSALSQAAQTSQLQNIPRNAGQIYQLYVEQLLQSAAGAYDATFVKSPILTLLAHRLAVRGETALVCNDDLYEEIAAELSQIQTRYHRRRQLMPHDWSAEGLIKELLTTSVLERVPESAESIHFTKRFYRDYFLAASLTNRRLLLEQLLTGPNPDEWYQTLSILLGIAPDPAAFFDQIPHTAIPFLAQLWFEHGPAGAAAPEPFQALYRRVLHDLETELNSEAQTPPELLHSTTPRDRYKEVLHLAPEVPRAVSALLDFAEDDHPVVRAAAEYALLHWGEDDDPGENQLIINKRHRRLTCIVSGGGTAQIGPYTLLSLPRPAAARVTVNISENDMDPFDAPAVFHFLHNPPDLVAASFFEKQREISWLELLIKLRQIALVSTQTARRAQSRPKLTALSTELGARAANVAAFGKLLAQDLNIPWGPIDLPEGVSIVPELPEQSYARLRRLFCRSNQERALLLAQSEKDTNFQVTQNIDTSHGSVWAIQVDSLQIDTRDDEHLEQYMYVSFVQNISLLQKSLSTGFHLYFQQNDSAMLPLVLRINGVINIKDSQASLIRGFRIDRFEGQAYGWKADIVVNIRRSSQSVIEGIVAEEPEVADEHAVAPMQT
jgi:hypothetical protein